jgi:hypothetical protein
MLATGDRIGAAPPSRHLCLVAKMLSLAQQIGTAVDGASLSVQQILETFDDHSFTRLLAINVAALSSKASRTRFDPDVNAKRWGIDKRLVE